jgi:hypothetical protein
MLVKATSFGFIRALFKGSVLQQLSTKWDSAFYVSVAQNGYPAGTVTGNYGFAPLYPGMIWLVNNVLGNYLLSAALVANAFSLLAVLAFYYVAETYFPPREALYASLALCFFPTFVTYGLVSYSEPVYLSLAILAVYFFLKGKYLFAGIASSLSILGNYVSLLAPVFLLGIIVLRKVRPSLLGQQRVRDGQVPEGTGATWWSKYGFVWLVLPLFVFGSWMYILDLRSMHPYSIFAAQAFWGTSVANPITQFQYFFTGIFSTQGNPVVQLLMRYPYTLSFTALAILLWKVDRGLTLYSSAFMLFVLSLVGGTYMSGPRLMLSAWPVLLVFGRTKKAYLAPIFVLFFVLSLESTYAQLTSFWT